MVIYSVFRKFRQDAFARSLGKGFGDEAPLQLDIVSTLI
jgi:hypothetical protein